MFESEFQKQSHEKAKRKLEAAAKAGSEAAKQKLQEWKEAEKRASVKTNKQSAARSVQYMDTKERQERAKAIEKYVKPSDRELSQDDSEGKTHLQREEEAVEAMLEQMSQKEKGEFQEKDSEAIAEMAEGEIGAVQKLIQRYPNVYDKMVHVDTEPEREQIKRAYIKELQEIKEDIDVKQLKGDLMMLRIAAKKNINK